MGQSDGAAVRAPADQLAGEVHSFARVFVGAFFDTIRNIYAAGAKRNSSTCARRRARPARSSSRPSGPVPAAPEHVRGRRQRMVQSDVTINNGANFQGDQRCVRARMA